MMLRIAHSFPLSHLYHMPSRAAHLQEDKKYNRRKQSPRLQHNERTSLNVELSSSGFDSHTGDPAKAVFTGINGKLKWSIFPT